MTEKPLTDSEKADAAKTRGELVEFAQKVNDELKAGEETRNPNWTETTTVKRNNGAGSKIQK